MEKTVRSRKETILYIVCIALFAVLLVVQAIISGKTSDGVLSQSAISGAIGIFSQIHVIIAVALTVIVRHRGFLTAVILNIINSAYVLFFGVIPGRSPEMLSGVLTPLVTIGICYIITICSLKAEESRKILNESSKAPVSETAEMNREDEKLSHTVWSDSLTGLNNERMFCKIINELTAADTEQPFAVIVANIDDFSGFNNRYGVSAGDDVLRTFAYRLNNFFGNTADIARLSGGQFGIILKGMRTKESLVSYISDLKSEICEAVSAGGKSVVLTMCVGVSISPRDGRSARELMSNAMIAVQMAESKGLNKTEFYNL